MRLSDAAFRVGDVVSIVLNNSGEYRSVASARIDYIEWIDVQTKFYHRYHLQGFTANFEEGHLFRTPADAAKWAC